VTSFLVRRLAQLLVTFFIASLLCFLVIQLPPNDIITRRMQTLEAMGGGNIEESIKTLKRMYNLDKPLIIQYVLWISGFFRGDFGYSLLYQAEARDLIVQRIPFTILLTLPALILAYAVAIALGLYSATHQYSLLDHLFTFLGMVGLATPDFLLALILLFITSQCLGMGVGGLLSPEFRDAPWSIAKVIDLSAHLWAPVLSLTAFYAAGLMRIMRGRTLELLHEPFVSVARSKGLKEKTVILKHVLRIAINPLISIAGLQLAEVVSGGVMVSIVMNLPTVGPLLLSALQAQDMYLGGSIIVLLIGVLLMGNFFADITLALVDPRIRFD